MAKQKTIKKFEEWKTDPLNWDAFFSLMEDNGEQVPLRFRDACMAIKMPYTLMHAHVKATPELKARYDSVRAANADRAIHETIEIADDVKDAAEAAAVAAAKLRIETRQKAASKWDKEDYGDTVRVEKSITVSVDQGLLGKASELLRLVKKPRPIAIDVEEVAALPEPAEGSGG